MVPVYCPCYPSRFTGNRLTSLASQLFADLDNVEELYVASPTHVIDRKGCFLLTVSHTANRDLQSNRIQVIELGAFAGLISLQIL